MTVVFGAAAHSDAQASPPSGAPVPLPAPLVPIAASVKVPSPTTLVSATSAYLADLEVHGYAATTRRLRHYHLAELSRFTQALGIDCLDGLTPSVLASYQRHLFAHRKVNGKPLSFRTQVQRLISAKAFFSWAHATGLVGFDPAASIILPKTEKRLPEATLSHAEAEAVLSVPDASTPLGLRDRAILEVLYSSAIRRGEVIHLQTYDVDYYRSTLFIRQGKGGRDRHVPISTPALQWVSAYCEQVRPALAGYRDTDTLFLSTNGTPVCPDWMSRSVAAYIHAAVPSKRGSCHLFRHSAATLMLEGGADIRYVGEMLGHAKLETTQVYTRVSIDKLRQVHAACHPGARPEGRPGERNG